MARTATRRPASAQLLKGTGRVTLDRVGGGAGPDWGAYALLYTTRPLPGGLEAVIAAALPEQLNPAWGLDRARPYGPTGSATRPLLAYAAAATPAPPKKQSAAAYDQRLARYLLETATGARRLPACGSVDLPAARWTIETEKLIHLEDPYAGHSAVRIGRLVDVDADRR